MQDRLKFCELYKNSEFENVICSYEVIFSLERTKAKMLFNDDEEALVKELFNPYNKKKKHFWGGISKKGLFPLYYFDNKVIAEEY